MTPLIVLDFDGTLIPFESLRPYVRQGLGRRHGWRVLGCVLRRALRLDDNARFVARLMEIRRQEPSYAQDMRLFAESLRAQLLPEVMALVDQRKTPDTRIVLCSASPHDYLAPLAAAQGWEILATGQSVGAGVLPRVYGIEKRRALEATYPPGEYQYRFALGDSEADRFLLEIFEEGLLWRDGKWQPVQRNPA